MPEETDYLRDDRPVFIDRDGIDGRWFAYCRRGEGFLPTIYLHNDMRWGGLIIKDVYWESYEELRAAVAATCVAPKALTKGKGIHIPLW